MDHSFDGARRSRAVPACAALLLLTAAYPLLGSPQNPQQPPAQGTPAAPAKGTSGASDKQAQRLRARREQRTNGAAPQADRSLRVAPAGQAGPGRPGPGGTRIIIGPDGKPMVVGSDGKPVSAGPGGNATINTPPPGVNFRGSGAGGGDFPPPGGMVSMDFRGADINSVLKFFAMATGWEIVPDPTLTGPVTIVSPKQLTTDQAFDVLQSVLQVRGFSGQLEKRGSTTVLKIVPIDRAVQQTTLLRTNGQPANSQDLNDQVVTEVIPVINADATALSRELHDLINKGASLVASVGTNALIVTDTASNVNRIATLV